VESFFIKVQKYFPRIGNYSLTPFEEEARYPQMFHKPISEVTDQERKMGKTINYALIYGQEAPGLDWNLNIPLDKAQQLIDRYFSSLPLIQKFKHDLRKRFLEEGYSETAFGRKIQLDLTRPKRERELRRGFNHIFQGTGADILRMTLVRKKKRPRILINFQSWNVTV